MDSLARRAFVRTLPAAITEEQSASLFNAVGATNAPILMQQIAILPELALATGKHALERLNFRPFLCPPPDNRLEIGFKPFF